MLCESRCVRNIHWQYWCQLFPLSRIGHNAMLHLNLRSLSLFKLLFEINLNHSFSLRVLRLDRPEDRDDSPCVCNLCGKKQLAVKLPDDSRVENHLALWYSWLFRQKLAFGLPWEFLYSNEILEHWPRGTFAAHSVKEWNVMATETNTATHS